MHLLSSAALTTSPAHRLVVHLATLPSPTSPPALQRPGRPAAEHTDRGRGLRRHPAGGGAPLHRELQGAAGAGGRAPAAATPSPRSVAWSCQLGAPASSPACLPAHPHLVTPTNQRPPPPPHPHPRPGACAGPGLPVVGAAEPGGAPAAVCCPAGAGAHAQAPGGWAARCRVSSRSAPPHGFQLVNWCCSSHPSALHSPADCRCRWPASRGRCTRSAGRPWTPPWLLQPPGHDQMPVRCGAGRMLLLLPCW